MFSMCSELTPRAHVPDNRIQLMQPWSWVETVSMKYSVGIASRRKVEKSCSNCLQRKRSNQYSKKFWSTSFTLLYKLDLTIKNKLRERDVTFWESSQSKRRLTVWIIWDGWLRDQRSVVARKMVINELGWALMAGAIVKSGWWGQIHPK